MHRRYSRPVRAAPETTMRRFARYLFLSLFAALGACESVDDYVGRTLDSLGSEPASRLAAKLPPKTGAAPVKVPSPKAAQSGQFWGAHSASLPEAPPGQVEIIREADARLSMTLRVFDGGRVARRRYTSVERRHIEEDALWTGPANNPVAAGMLLSESLGGPPVTDAEDPAEIVDHWAAFRGKRRTFGDLVGSENALGSVLWRRSRVADSTCVAFLQRWSINSPSGPASSLSGFYCAAPGETLTPGEAETVVQSLGISAPKG